MTSDANQTNKASTRQWWVYIAATQSGKLYTGITTDLERRFLEHQSNPKKGAKFFRSDPASHLVFTQPLPDRSSASQREAIIKKMTRKEKLLLIEQGTQ